VACRTRKDQQQEEHSNAHHHGWSLSSDDWDAQMLFFVGRGFRVIAHDRRGHGRSAQVADGHDMDHYTERTCWRSSRGEAGAARLDMAPALLTPE